MVSMIVLGNCFRNQILGNVSSQVCDATFFAVSQDLAVVGSTDVTSKLDQAPTLFHKSDCRTISQWQFVCVRWGNVQSMAGKSKECSQGSAVADSYQMLSWNRWRALLFDVCGCCIAIFWRVAYRFVVVGCILQKRWKGNGPWKCFCGSTWFGV